MVSYVREKIPILNMKIANSVKYKEKKGVKNRKAKNQKRKVLK